MAYSRQTEDDAADHLVQKYLDNQADRAADRDMEEDMMQRAHRRPPQVIPTEDYFRGLTIDDIHFLAWGCDDRTVPYLPDGIRHYAAVQNLRKAGLVRYNDHGLEVTDEGRQMYADWNAQR